MSHYASAKAFKVRGITPACKVVLYHLADRANEGHTGHEGRSMCWPSLSKLERDTELSRKGLTKILAELELKGVIARVKNAPAFPGYTGETTLYEVLPAREHSTLPSQQPQHPAIPETRELSTLPDGGRELSTLGNRVPQARELDAPQLGNSVPSNLVREPVREPVRASAPKLLPPDCPTLECREKAARYWGERGRVDLDADDEAFRFRAHHTANGTRMASWPSAWVTWYSNAVRFQRAPNGHGNSAATDSLARMMQGERH